jgi:mannose-6-phosphate isomerase-like protein (cupin superfamily)
MIAKVFPSAADFENLSRVRTLINTEANTFDYTRCVVNKPWGYEYLWYQDDKIAIWFLYLGHSKATSLHCHAKKRTSLLLVHGKAISSTLENRYKLSPGDAIVLEPCVFHSTISISEQGIYVLEIETPPLKADLVRLKDAFGRQGIGYENAQEYSQDFSRYHYIPYFKKTCPGPLTVGNFKVDVKEFTVDELLSPTVQSAELVVPLNHAVQIHHEKTVSIGEAFNPSIFDWDQECIRNIKAPTRLLILTDDDQR